MKPGHSSCTAAKAIGNRYGAARFANLVIVKMPDKKPDSIAEGFSTITDHISINKRRGRSVVVVSWGSSDMYQWNGPNKEHWVGISKNLIELSKTSTSVMFAAGNSAHETDKEGKPRLKVDTAH